MLFFSGGNQMNRRNVFSVVLAAFASFLGARKAVTKNDIINGCEFSDSSGVKTEFTPMTFADFRDMTLSEIRGIVDDCENGVTTFIQCGTNYVPKKLPNGSAFFERTGEIDGPTLAVMWWIEQPIGRSVGDCDKLKEQINDT